MILLSRVTTTEPDGEYCGAAAGRRRLGLGGGVALGQQRRGKKQIEAIDFAVPDLRDRVEKEDAWRNRAAPAET
jgi:hypothetical protein